MITEKFVTGPIQTNTYLIYDETSKAAIIIDPGDEEPKIKGRISVLGLEPMYIMLTHGHFDHTSGIAYFKEQYPNIKILASRAERDFLYHREKHLSVGGIKADEEVKDGDLLEFGGLSMRFIMTPGHTPGGMCIYFPKEHVLFSGDTLFFASIGRTDLEGGDEIKLAESLKKLMKLPDQTTVYPGHGIKTDIGYEKRYNPFV